MSTVPLQRRIRAVSPASLTQAGTRPSGSCPECGSERVTALTMTLTDGTPVDFASCHDCEHRHWTHEGQVLDFADVIGRATKQRAS
jgi:transcription elongation factor Elf1